MALKAKVADVNSLPEAVRALYRQVDDYWLLDVEAADGYALEDINGLRTTLGKQKTDIANLKTTLKAFEVDGTLIDPSSAAAALAQIKQLGNLTPEQLADQKVKSALEQATTGFTKQIDEQKAANAKLLANLKTVMIDQAATTAIATKGGNIKLLLPHVKSNVNLVQDDKGFHTQVVDGEGNGRIYVANGKTSDMTLDQLIEEMAVSTDFAAAFTAPGNPGGGTQPANGSRGTGTPKVIRATDQNAVNGSIESIAAGKTQVELG